MKRTDRILFVAAVTDLVLGLGIHVFAGDFSAPAYDGLRPYFPFLSLAFTAGGILLFVQFRYPVHTWLRRAVTLLAAAPMLGMAIFLVVTMECPGAPITYGFLAVAALVTAWPGDGIGAGDRTDLTPVTLAAMTGLMGALLLVIPGAFHPTMFNSIQSVLPWAGVLGLTSATAALLCPVVTRRFGLGAELWLRPIVAAMPALLAYNFAMAGWWTGAIAWGIWVAVVAIPAVPWPQLRSAPNLFDITGPGRAFPDLERNLETWTWLQALLVASLSTLVKGEILAVASMTGLFVLSSYLFNLGLHWAFPHLGRPVVRVAIHLSFLTVAVGLLATGVGPLAKVFLVPLVLLPAIGTLALGAAGGGRLLALALLVLVVGNAKALLLSHLDLSLVAASTFVETAVLAAAGLAAIRAAADRARLAAVLDATVDVVVVADAKLRPVYLNRAARRLFGLSDLDDAAASGAPEHRSSWAQTRLFAEAAPVADRDGVWTGETALVAPNGQEVPFSQVLLTHRSMQGRVEYYSMVARDIRERKALEAKLAQLADCDTLTGLVNRRRFVEELAQELARAQRDQVRGAVLYLDFDEFKSINDRYGHAAGDAALRAVADRIRGRVRKSDVVARLGGDEFGIILRNADARDARMLADNVLAMAQPVPLPGAEQDVRLTASVGIALYPEHGASVEELLARADMAMYQAKLSAPGQVALFVPGQVAAGYKMRYRADGPYGRPGRPGQSPV